MFCVLVVTKSRLGVLKRQVQSLIAHQVILRFCCSARFRFFVEVRKVFISSDFYYSRIPRIQCPSYLGKGREQVIIIVQLRRLLYRSLYPYNLPCHELLPQLAPVWPRLVQSVKQRLSYMEAVRSNPSEVKDLYQLNWKCTESRNLIKGFNLNSTQNNINE